MLEQSSKTWTDSNISIDWDWMSRAIKDLHAWKDIAGYSEDVISAVRNLITSRWCDMITSSGELI